MPAILTVDAIEESTLVITAAFTDETGAAVVPTSLNWSLLDASGNVMNSRSEVALTPAAIVKIVLTGNDLALPATSSAVRKVLLQGRYDSSNGTGLYLKETAQFSIINLPGVT